MTGSVRVPESWRVKGQAQPGWLLRGKARFCQREGARDGSTVAAPAKQGPGGPVSTLVG